MRCLANDLVYFALTKAVGCAATVAYDRTIFAKKAWTATRENECVFVSSSQSEPTKASTAPRCKAVKER